MKNKKLLDLSKPSVYQLIELYSETDKGVPRSCHPTPKAHATLFFKKSPSFVFRTSKNINWQSRMESNKTVRTLYVRARKVQKDFILKNQRSRQTAKNSIEKIFYKLLNNSNFGYYCRNNLDNCTFVPIFDELNEVIYPKKYYSLYDQKISKSVSSDFMKQDAEEQYDDAMQRISKDNPSEKLKWQN